MSGTWTHARVETLKTLWARHLSASEIAGELGGVTRNAVIGKVHRLGLSGFDRPRSNVPRVPRAPRPPKPPRPRVMRVANHGSRFDVVEVFAPDPLPPESAIVIPIGQRCSLFELSDSKCRWPIGDPGAADFFFCGGKPAGDLPYCAYHARISYQPSPDRTRRRDRPAHDHTTHR